MTTPSHRTIALGAEYELALLRALSAQFPSVDAAMAEIARMSAVLTLPKGNIHVISDIHGEDKKLRHVINNASGTLRPLIERMFSQRMDAKQFQEFITLSFYPAEVIERMEQNPLPAAELRAYALRTLRNQFELVRVLTARYSLKRAMEVYPPEYKGMLIEMLHVPPTERGAEFLEAIVDKLQQARPGAASDPSGRSHDPQSGHP